ncbi:MAG: hypothetical protein QOE90_3332 [Thermoplasmata archaeon]|nr:hypothetical protein [Thermoplasmata archaeon]
MSVGGNAGCSLEAGSGREWDRGVVRDGSFVSANADRLNIRPRAVLNRLRGALGLVRMRWGDTAGEREKDREHGEHA